MNLIISEKEAKEAPPSCLGNLDIVFPVDEKGLRRICENCFSCTHVRTCLQEAMESEAGLKFKEERIDQAYGHGLINAFQRWSEKKALAKKHKWKEEEIDLSM
jgi:hypothetical protein